MIKKRGFASTILMVFIVSCLCSLVYAGEIVSLEVKAERLNKISLLLGDNGNYMLDNALKRSDASVFIVRMLGKEDEVKANVGQYKNTKFKDVSPSAWYAPYIGYCAAQGILEGYPDGTFGPLVQLSEKSFLKMLLGTLGYRHGVDFTWETIYTFSYQTGLTNDDRYLNKTNDNTDFTRGNVVGYLYQTLFLNNKDTKLPMLNTLINKGKVSTEAAKAAGLIQSDAQTAVVTAIPKSATSLLLTLNESIENITAKDVLLYETDTLTNIHTQSLNVAVESQLGTDILLKTEGLIPGKSYTLMLYNLVDLNGVYTGGISVTFSGYMNDTVTSQFFKISKIETLSRNAVNVYFTQPINGNAENAEFFNIYKDGNLFAKASENTLTCKRLNSVDNGITLYLNGITFDENAEYTLRISGELSSLYSAKLKEGIGDSTTFMASNHTGEELIMDSVKGLSQMILQLSFNKVVNPALAQQAKNYSITDYKGIQIEIEKATVSGDGKRIFLKLKDVPIKGRDYSLKIKQLFDETFQYSMIEKIYAYEMDYPETTYLIVVEARNIDLGTVEVYFDKPIDAVTAGIPLNYGITEASSSSTYGVNPIKVVFDPKESLTKVRLYLPSNKPLIKGVTYKLTVTPTVKDEAGNVSNKIVEYWFNSGDKVGIKPAMTEADLIAKDMIRVRFNKEIYLENVTTLASNYSLNYQKAGALTSKKPVNVVVIDGRTIILKFDSLDLDANNMLMANSIIDCVGNIANISDSGSRIQVSIGK